MLLWDRGSWSPVGDPLVGYRRGRLKFTLNGQKLRGLWNLVRMGPRHEKGKENWLLIKEKDDEARSGEKSDVTESLTESVASGRTIDQIASGRHQVWQSNRPGGKYTKSVPHPRKTGRKHLAGARRAPQEESSPPQLATLADKAPVGEKWVHELKYDGYRILCRVKHGSAKLVTRNDHDWTAKLQRIAEAAAALPVKNCMARWRSRRAEAGWQHKFSGACRMRSIHDQKRTLAYYVFDLLYLNGYDMRQVGLLDRKQALAGNCSKRHVRIDSI